MHSIRRQVHQAVIFIALLGAAAALQTGCGGSEDTADEYSNLDTQVLKRTIEAAASGPPQDTLKKIDRLEGVYPQAEFVDRLRTHEKKRQGVRKLNTMLTNGDLEAAQKLAEQFAMNSSYTEFSARVDNILNALSALRDYMQHQPYPEAEKARQALQNLRRTSEPLTGFTFYEDWLEQQDGRISKRRTKEKKWALRQLLYEFDLNSMRGKPIAETILAQVTADALPENAKDFTSGRLQREIISITGRCPLAMQQYGLDIGLEHKTEHSPPTEANASAVLIRAVRLAKQKEAQRAVDLLKELPLKGTGLASQPTSVLLEQLLMPKEQLRAACWRQPFPDVPSYLTRLMHLYRFRKNPHSAKKKSGADR